MQQQPNTKVIVNGIATVVLLVVLGIGLSALSKGSHNDSPSSTPTMANTSEPTNTPKPTATEIPGPSVLSVDEAQRALFERRR